MTAQKGIQRRSVERGIPYFVKPVHAWLSLVLLIYILYPSIQLPAFRSPNIVGRKQPALRMAGVIGFMNIHGEDDQVSLFHKLTNPLDKS